MKVGTLNQEKVLVGTVSVITNLRMDLRFKLYTLDTMDTADTDTAAESE